MHIVYITERTPFGPGEDFLFAEIDTLKAKNNRVTIIPVRIDLKFKNHTSLQELQKISIPIPFLGLTTLKQALSELIRHPFRVTFLAINILRASGFNKNGLRNLLVFPKALATAHFIRKLAPDHIHAYWATVPATVGYVVSELTGIPWSFTAHRWDLEEEKGISLKVKHAKFVRCISAHGHQFLTAKLDQDLRSKVLIVHLGVKIPQVANSVFRRDSQFKIGMPANMIATKGHKYLLEAAELLQKEGIVVEVHLYGDGPLETCLKEYTLEHGLTDSVIFHGRVSHSEMLVAYKTLHLVVLPSSVEGIPISLMEAMSFGIPVIGTQIPGIIELLHDGAGMMVPCNDSGALARAIKKVLSSQEEYRGYAISGRERVKADFNVGINTDEILLLMGGATCLHSKFRSLFAQPGGSRL